MRNQLFRVSGEVDAVAYFGDRGLSDLFNINCTIGGPVLLLLETMVCRVAIEHPERWVLKSGRN
jgi:hypothetical protein